MASTQAEKAAWLATTVEEALDPERVICDPHHHLWDHPNSRYLLEELHEDTGASHNVIETVFVECSSAYRSDGPESMRPVGETEFVAEIAAASEKSSGATIAGIVGFADLTLGDAVKGVLEAHVEAGQGRFRGIRHASAWHADPAIHNAHTRPGADLFELDSFRKGIDVLGELGLSFDAWLYHPQIRDLTALASAKPDVPMLLDHLGGPLGVGPYKGQREEVREAWRPMILDLAKRPNVFVKLGGIGMSIYGCGWHRQERAPTSEQLAEAWGEDILFCIEHFGAERCMFESNFPVDKQGCSYTVLWNAFQRISGGASESEKDDLFHDSAARFYRL